MHQRRSSDHLAAVNAHRRSQKYNNRPTKFTPIEQILHSGIDCRQHPYFAFLMLLMAAGSLGQVLSKPTRSNITVINAISNPSSHSHHNIEFRTLSNGTNTTQLFNQTANITLPSTNNANQLFLPPKPKHNESKQQPKNQDKLNNLIEKMKITYNKNDYQTLYNVSRKSYIHTCEKMEAQIRRMIRCAINTDVLTTVLTSPSFEIRILPPSKLDAFGAYMYSENHIHIQWDSTRSDTQTLLMLANELQHASICALQQQNGIRNTEKCLLFPELNKLEKEMKKANTEIFSYMRSFDFYYLYNSVIKPSEEDKKFLAVVASYEPLEGTRIITNEEHKKVFSILPKQLPNGRFHIPKDTVIDGQKLQGDMYIRFDPNGPNHMRYKVIFAKDDSVLERGRAFFIDLMQRQGDYHKGYNAFSMKSNANKVAEQLSDIECFPPALKRLFYPDFCRLFSKFHRVTDYCKRPSIGNCKPK